MTVEPDPDKTWRRDLRRTIRSQLGFVPIEERRLELDALSAMLPAPGRPLRILCYLGDGVEIDLDPVIQQLLNQGAEVAVPAVLSEAGHMQAIRLSSMESA